MANEMDESMTDYLEMSFPFNMDNASNACADSDLHLPNQMYGATGYERDQFFEPQQSISTPPRNQLVIRNPFSDDNDSSSLLNHRPNSCPGNSNLFEYSKSFCIQRNRLQSFGDADKFSPHENFLRRNMRYSFDPPVSNQVCKYPGGNPGPFPFRTFLPPRVTFHPFPMPHFIRTPNPHIKFCGPPIPHPHSQQIPSTNAMPINQPCVEAQASCIPVPEHQSLQPPKATKSKKESSKSKKAKNAIQQPSSPKSKMIADSRSPMNEINNVMPLSAPSETPCFKVPIKSPPNSGRRQRMAPKSRICNDGVCAACSMQISVCKLKHACINYMLQVQNKGIRCTGGNQDCVRMRREAIQHIADDERIEWLCDACLNRNKSVFLIA